MKILVIYPIHVPHYWNLCYHFTRFGELIGYLQRDTSIEVEVFDGGVLSLTWGDLARKLMEGFDLIIVMNSFDNIVETKRTFEFCKNISKKTKILTYGPMSVVMPHFFQRYELDAIIYSGDWEIITKKYIDFLKAKCKIEDLNGILLYENSKWIKTKEGSFIDPSQWGFPALDLLPLKDYERVGNERELSLTISRGCPRNCNFCITHKLYGRKDRRRPINSALDFIEKNIKNFDYVSMYSPIFTLDRNYVIDFCKEIKKRNLSFRWKCVTTINNIDKELIEKMANSGCFKISFGIETLKKDAQDYINKKIDEHKTIEVIKTCIESKIQPQCFLIIGIPGQTINDINETITKLISLGAKVRLTALTPFNDLNENMSEEEIEKFNKKTIHNVSGMDKSELSKLLWRV